MNSVRFRPATADDMPRVFELIGELAAFEELSHQVTGSVDELRAALCGDAPAARCTVAELGGGDVVGYAITFPTFSTFRMKRGLWLEDLYVTPRARRCGIGRSFLERLAREAADAGCARFEWSVLDWNENAQRLYRSFGAQILPEWQTCRLEGEELDRYRS